MKLKNNQKNIEELTAKKDILVQDGNSDKTEGTSGFNSNKSISKSEAA